MLNLDFWKKNLKKKDITREKSNYGRHPLTFVFFESLANDGIAIVLYSLTKYCEVFVKDESILFTGAFPKTQKHKDI